MSDPVLRMLWREQDLEVLRGLFGEIEAVGDPDILMDYGTRWNERSWSLWARENVTLIGSVGADVAGCMVLDFQKAKEAVLHVVRLPWLTEDDARWFFCELRRQYPTVALMAHLGGPLRRHARLSALRHGFKTVDKQRSVFRLHATKGH